MAITDNARAATAQVPFNDYPESIFGILGSDRYSGCVAVFRRYVTDLLTHS